MALALNNLYHTHDTDMWNVHIMFIIYIHRTQESRNTKNTYEFLVQVRNFLLPLSLKVLRHKERDTYSFFSGFSICPPPLRAAPVARKFILPLRAPKVDLLVRCLVLNSTDWLFQNPPNPPRASGAWRHPHSLAPFPIWAIVTSLSDTSVPPARVTTCVNVAPK